MSRLSRLSANATLQGILTCIEDGIHENAGFAYHGFGGLQQMLHRKNQRIKFYKLQGLNQAWKLLGKAAALSEQKQLLMAISSGETKQLDGHQHWLLSTEGVRGLLALVTAAAQGYYQPKSYLEEEDMKALLIWKLSGNRVAEINHCALGAPSVSYLRTQSTVPQIIPSHAQPELQQVKSNIEATITSILDEIHNIRRGRGDLEELFKQIDDGNVHYAGKARLLQLAPSAYSAKIIEFTLGNLFLSLETAREKQDMNMSRLLFKPNDPQDVKLAFDMLNNIWLLPQVPASNTSPGFCAAREALWMLGKLLYYMAFPYLCVNLLLSEQIEHFSAAAHLAIALYKLARKDFLPTNLYVDLVLMIKNVLFCVAKAKADDPNGEFWIILLGTDCLKELFGILCTMVGNDANLDILQLVLRLPNSKEIPNTVDHIKPASWQGNVKVKDASLQTSWNRGRQVIENECKTLKTILAELMDDEDINLLAPYGTLLVDIPLAPDNIDKSIDSFPNPSTNIPIDPNAVEACIEVEDALLTLGPQAIKPKVRMYGKEILKAQALLDFSKFQKQVGLTDCLCRVQDIERHIQSQAVSSNMPETCLETLPANEEDILILLDSMASLLSLDRQIWLCLGEVNSMKVDNRPVTRLSLGMLTEKTVTISYQILGLQPAMEDNDPEEIHDWRTYRRMDECSFIVPGCLVQPLNPLISKSHLPGQIPWFLFQSTVLVASAASLSEQLTASQLTSVPKIAASKEYPYCKASAAQCKMFLKKVKGAHTSLTINPESSRGCLLKIKYLYPVASIHFLEKHKNAMLSKYKHLWKLHFEVLEMRKIWTKRKSTTVKHTRKTSVPLIVSKDHCAQIPSNALIPDGGLISAIASLKDLEFKYETDDDTELIPEQLGRQASMNLIGAPSDTLVNIAEAPGNGSVVSSDTLGIIVNTQVEELQDQQGGAQGATTRESADDGCVALPLPHFNGFPSQHNMELEVEHSQVHPVSKGLDEGVGKRETSNAQIALTHCVGNSKEMNRLLAETDSETTDKEQISRMSGHDTTQMATCMIESPALETEQTTSTEEDVQIGLERCCAPTQKAVDALNGCLCGEVVNPLSDELAVQCLQGNWEGQRQCVPDYIPLLNHFASNVMANMP
ncbi:hypothetical protein B0H34DRAFT_671602 [Crassisporium funariophilum]|nr:hypothetical protein B0H34DRAFT_671602 [Crassisporium funariophilum]